MPNVISIKIGSSRTGPTKRMLRDFEDAARLCNYVRNKAIAWVLDRAEATIDVQLGKLTGLARAKNREELIAKGKLSELVALKYLYKPTSTTLFPQLSSSSVSACCRDVMQMLSRRMAWDQDKLFRFEDGSTKLLKQWQGIMLGRCQRSTWNTLRIPIMAGKNRVSKLKREEKSGSYLLDFPLWSKAAGRKETRGLAVLLCREHSGLPMIRRVVADPMLFRDSELLQKRVKGGKLIWLLQLTYATPSVAERDSAIVGELGITAPNNDRYPFEMFIQAGQQNGQQNGHAKPSPWGVGTGGKYVAYKEEYHWRKKKVLGLRYSDSARDARDGHGRGVVYEKLRPQVRAARDARMSFVRQLLSDVLKWCERNKAGKLIYREPSRPLRDGSWFAKNGVPFPWSVFGPRLIAKLETAGIRVEVRTERLAEYASRCGIEQKEVFAKITPATHATGVASVHYEDGSGKARHDKAPLATGKAKRVLATGSEEAIDADEE